MKKDNVISLLVKCGINQGMAEKVVSEIEEQETQKEVRVYLIDLNDLTEEEEKLDINNLPDEEFMSISEKQGEVYTLDNFQKEWNRENVIFNSFIRFIEVETSL